MATAIATAEPELSFWDRLSTPRALIILIVLMWVPLTLHVMFGGVLGPLKDIVLIPAIPATVLLYVLAIRSWRESTVAVIGVTLVCFWLLMAVTVMKWVRQPPVPIRVLSRPVWSTSSDFSWLKR